MVPHFQKTSPVFRYHHHLLMNINHLMAEHFITDENASTLPAEFYAKEFEEYKKFFGAAVTVRSSAKKPDHYLHPLVTTDIMWHGTHHHHNPDKLGWSSDGDEGRWLVVVW